MNQTPMILIAVVVFLAMYIKLQIWWNKTLKETKASNVRQAANAREFARAAALARAQKLAKMSPDARELYLQNEQLIANQEEALRLTQRQTDIAGFILGNEIRNRHHRHHR